MKYRHLFSPVMLTALTLSPPNPTPPESVCVPSGNAGHGHSSGRNQPGSCRPAGSKVYRSKTAPHLRSPGGGGWRPWQALAALLAATVSSLAVFVPPVPQAPSYVDPLAWIDYNPARRVPWIDNPVYTRSIFEWHLEDTGQPSNLYYNGAYQSTESGGSLDLDLLRAWSSQPAAPSIKIAVVDTGCKEWFVVDGYTFDGPTRGHFFHDRSPGTRSAPGHGSFIAWLAHRVSRAPILSLATSYAQSDIAEGIVWSVNHGAKIIVLAWGTASPDPRFYAACQYANACDVVIVASAPNAAVNLDTAVDYPASWRLPNVIPATSYDRTGRLYGAAAGGSLTLAAPGRNVVGRGIGGVLRYGTGTSYSAPLLAGCLALLAEHRPGEKMVDLVSILRITSKPLISGASRSVSLPDALEYVAPPDSAE